MSSIVRVAALAAVAAFAIGLGGCNQSCEDGGRLHEDGEAWECSDGCNSCSCDNGSINSTAVACIDAGIPGD